MKRSSQKTIPRPSTFTARPLVRGTRPFQSLHCHSPQPLFGPDLSSGNEPSYLTNRAAARMALKQFASALADCQQAASLQTESPSAKTLIRLARCQTALGSTTAALSTIRAVFDLEPTNSVALQLQTKISQLEKHQANYCAAMKNKQWTLARMALDQCLQGIEGEGGEIPIEWRIWRIELELARSNWDGANTSAK